MAGTDRRDPDASSQAQTSGCHGILKGAGQQLESWQQESGRAVFNRLLIASQACALVWRLMRAQGEYAQRTRTFLVRLSGRQTKRKQPVTAPALLQGLYLLFAMCDTLQHYSPSELTAFAQHAFGPLPTRPTRPR